MFRANIKQSGFSLLWSLAVAALQCYGISGQRSLTRKMRRVYKAHIMKQAASLRFALLFSIVLFASASSPGQSSPGQSSPSQSPPGQMTVYFPSATHPQVRMMTVDDVIRLSKAGLSDDVIIQQIKKKGQRFDLSADQLIQLKSASVSERVIQVMIDPTRNPSPSPGEKKTGFPTPQQAGQSSGRTPDATPADLAPPAQPFTANPALPAQAAAQHLIAPAQSVNKPRVYLSSSSKGSQWNAARDQSMEMSKDFEKDCPGIRVTINQTVADYSVLLNHIEHGFARDNQIQIANKDGDLISRTKEGGSIRGDVKKACEIILADWAKK